MSRSARVAFAVVVAFCLSMDVSSGSLEESMQHRLIVVPLDVSHAEEALTGEPEFEADAMKLVHVETTNYLSDKSSERGPFALSRSLGGHLFKWIDPMWVDLSMRGRLDSGHESMEWCGCGGVFREGWTFNKAGTAEAGAAEAAQRVFHLAVNHHHCGFSTFSMCSSHNRTRRDFLRDGMLFGSVTSTPMRVDDDVPLHRRPTGVFFRSGPRQWCGSLSTAHDTLCTQHIAPLIPEDPIVSESSIGGVFGLAAPSLPFVLGSRWHHFSLRISHSPTEIVVRRRLSFVLSSRDELETFRKHVEATEGRWAAIENLTTLVSFAQPSSAFEDEAVSLKMFVARHSGDVGGTISYVIRGRQPLPPLLDLLIQVPLSVIAPTLHRLETSEGTTATAVTRVTDTTLQTMFVHVRIAVSAKGLTMAVATLPYKVVFVGLIHRPPDANKFYRLPPAVLRYASTPPFCERAEIDHEEIASVFLSMHDAGEASQRRTFGRHRCYRFARSIATAPVAVSLAVPDSAMVFNVLTLGLLPVAVLVGSVLRMSGRSSG